MYEVNCSSNYKQCLCFRGLKRSANLYMREISKTGKKVFVHEENQRREGDGGKKRRAFLLSIEKSPVDPDPTI